MSKKCFECGESFPGRPGKLFCCEQHRQTFANRNTVRGKVIAPLAIAWRHKRGSGDTAKAAFKELCRILDRYASEDKEAGRQPMEDYVAAMMGSHHTRLMDR